MKPIVAIVFLLSGCVTIAPPEGTQTERALCRVWGNSLPTRSRSDTDQTKQEIQKAYLAFSLACPDYEHLIPNFKPKSTFSLSE